MKQSRSIYALALAVMTAAGSAHADDPVPLRQLLSVVPETILETEAKQFPLAATVDLATARRLLPDGKGTMSKELMRRLSAGGMIRPLSSWWRYHDMGVWEGQVAVAPTEIDAFVGYNSPPQEVAVWFLRNDASAKTVFDDLPNRGFTAIEGGMVANGNPGAIDIKGRRPGDPWRGELGKTSVVAREGRNLFQAAFPPVVAAARNASTSNITTQPVVDAVLRGAEALSKDGTRIVQAFLSSPIIGFDGSMPILEPKTVDEMRKKLEEKMARDRATGLPPYAMALIADIDMPGKGHGVAVVFAHLGCDQAERGGKQFIKRWNEIPTFMNGQTLAQLAPTDAAARTVPGSNGLCANVVTLTSRTPVAGADLANRPWDVIYNAIMQRDFVAAVMAPGGR